MRTIVDMEGFKVEGQHVKSIKRVDDTALIAESAKKLQWIIERIDAVDKNMGLKIKRRKTQLMVISKSTAWNCNFTV